MVAKKRVSRKKTLSRSSGHSKQQACSHCHKSVPASAKFCHYCGKGLSRPKQVAKHHCPSCKGVIEGFSRFCKHCGANIDTFAHSTFVKVLLSFIVFLVIALALLIIFAPSFVEFDTQTPVAQVDPFLAINNGLCTWDEDHFTACANVNWGGSPGDYMQCGFSGTTADKKWGTSPLTCCGSVGTNEGNKLVRTFLFDRDGAPLQDDSVSVACSGKPSSSSVTPDIPSFSDYQKSFWITVEAEGKLLSATGTKTIQFPSKVKQCTVSGRWETRADPIHGNTDAGFCVGAEGIFYGEADLFGQTVFTDPSTFFWAGYEKALLDPPGRTYENYAVYADLCDSTYYIEPRHQVTGRLTGFETDTLTFQWDYYSNYPRPNMDIFVDLTCDVY